MAIYPAEKLAYALFISTQYCKVIVRGRKNVKFFSRAVENKIQYT